MPSGSHGGRAGSHGGFSGGGGGRSRSSFGGSRTSGSFRPRSGGGFRPRGPRPFHFGRRVYIVSSGRQSVLSLIIIAGLFLVMGLIINFGTLSSFKEDKRMIEEENRYYISMVERAESDSRYMVEGTVEEQFYKTEYERYYITYTFETDAGNTVSGYTFSIYTLDNVPAKGSTIWLAVDDLVVDTDTDSVPMDYDDFTLEDDGEYLKVKKTISKATWKIVLFIGLIVVAVGGYILVIVTAKKKQEEKEETEKAEQKAKEEAEEKKRFCEYCGARVEPSDSVCPQCGARLR